RFTWLVDVFYDHRVKLVIAAEAPAHELYVAGPHAEEFKRTVSRLIEMRSREYLVRRHRPHSASSEADGSDWQAENAFARLATWNDNREA
ncbi:MAG: AFG1/ZapE family ATPase, partial [Methylocystis sp.]|nr:AFG1/ZapE family ATPase [Methylocystis sp.]